ncbi:FtsW/RodA/SpoVE family cell cycle protein [Bacillus sp. FJAT-49736]|uniref:FtsW/RodA/SpoVE family cell cycle protein n=1 Tax=Bacillus sp. FJAT-49736 TaxID=2833582 RepID=UPI001BCA2F5E|nr:FtsW/RodA/SpoVE family cell cycle protein [Bacillus sp. FJAT-49736]MBS4175465.1 rod shape-determining protein RodA [Bacillus sp. FJAT-49736]
MEKQNRFIDKIDWTLVLLLFLFFLVSCISIYSAQTSNQYGKNFVMLQGFWYILGFIIIACSLFFEPSQYNKLAFYLYGIGIVMLIGLIIAPHCPEKGCLVPKRNGAISWYILPGVGAIQPSEFMKTFIILAISKVIAGHHEKVRIKTFKTDVQLLLKIGVTAAIPLGLIMLQPDLGTSLVILVIVSGLILVSGITWKILVPLYGALITLGGTVLYLVISAPELVNKYLKAQAYQFDRIYTWIDPYSYPDEGRQLRSSIMSIGSGEVFGKGFMGQQVYLPERHTDFIFSVIGEEYGFIGSSLVICLFFVLIYHLTKTAIITKERFNTYICAGVIAMITFHVFQNIGMTIQVLPITGIPLPFISYGGSSLMGNMLALGVIFSIRFHHKEYMFSSSTDKFYL